MRRTLLFGLETESSILTPGGDEIARTDALGRLFEEVGRRFVHLPGRGSSRLFFENGCCLYAEGHHPEICTAEVSTPWDLVRWAAAGDQMLAAAAKRCGLVIYTGNVDYHGATFGSHESYCHLALPQAIPNKMLPHLVARVILVGAGGFSPASPGIEFTLSPRAHYLRTAVSSNSTRDRGIYHLKNEPLARAGLNRLHLICGESLQSQVALFLRFGTTALVLAAIDGGIPIHEQEVALKDPVQALHAFAADPTCTATAETRNGRRLSAIQIERHYLDILEAYRHDDRLPDWTAAICSLWRDLLDQLTSGGPSAVAGRLNWAIKYQIYTDYISRRGYCWESLARWTPLVAAVRQGKPGDRGRITQGSGVDRDRLEEVVALRERLFEMDIRFSQLGEEGLFARIDRAGVLDHRVPGVEPIVGAMSEPPPGRATARGHAIRQLARCKRTAAASWESVFDFRRKRVLDLKDPFAARYDWAAIPPESPEPSSLLEAPDVQRMYRRGEFARAIEVLARHDSRRGLCRYGRARPGARERAWLHARYGLLDAMNILDDLYRDTPDHLTMIGDYLQVLRYNYLAPRAEMGEWVERARPLLANAPAGDGQAVVSWEYIGWYELSIGRAEEALRTFKNAHENEGRGLNDDRILARIRCGLAESNRHLHRPDEARGELARAEAVQRAGEYRSDWAANLTIQAKLEPERTRALFLLARAQWIQGGIGDRMGLSRALLLETRLTASCPKKARNKARLIQLQGQIPALQACPTFARILGHWDEWAAGDSTDTTGERFWGL